MLKEYKSIKEVVGPLMLVENVSGVTYNELVEIEQAGGEIRQGKVLEVNRDRALVQLFEVSQGLKISTSKARFLGKSIELPVSMDMLGRVFVFHGFKYCLYIVLFKRIFKLKHTFFTVCAADSQIFLKCRKTKILS